MPSPGNNIITPQAIKANTVVVTLANAVYNPPGPNIAEIIQAGPNGARLIKLGARPIANVTATELQEYRDKDGTGTNKRFSNSASALAHTKVQTAAAPFTAFEYSDASAKMLAPGEKVSVGVGVAGSWVFEAEWLDY